MELKVVGMSCNHCAMKVKKALSELKVKKVKIDLESGVVSFKENKKVTIEEIINAIVEAGYQVE